MARKINFILRAKPPSTGRHHRTSHLYACKHNWVLYDPVRNSMVHPACPSDLYDSGRYICLSALGAERMLRSAAGIRVAAVLQPSELGAQIRCWFDAANGSSRMTPPESSGD